MGHGRIWEGVWIYFWHFLVNVENSINIDLGNYAFLHIDFIVYGFVGVKYFELAIWTNQPTVIIILSTKKLLLTKSFVKLLLEIIRVSKLK